MPWKKGESGNLSGRPKGWSDISELARKNSRQAILRLVELCRSKDEHLALKACNAVLDRAWGKPPQAIMGPDEGPIQVDATHGLLEVLRGMATNGKAEEG